MSDHNTIDAVTLLSLDPVRTVILVDDEFPPFDRVLNLPQAPPAEETPTAARTFDYERARARLVGLQEPWLPVRR